VVAWQGLVGDNALASLALDVLLNRYLLSALGVHPDAGDAVWRCRRLVLVLPTSWRGPQGVFRTELGRFAAYLAGVGKTARNLGPEGLGEVTKLLKELGYTDMAETVRRERAT